MIEKRFTSAREFALWSKEMHEMGMGKYLKVLPTVPLALLKVTCSLLNRQLKPQSDAFQQEGGFTERLYRNRVETRTKRLIKDQ